MIDKTLPLKKIKSYFDLFVLSLNNNSPDTKGTYERALREFFRWNDCNINFTFSVKEIEKYKSYLTKKKKLAPVSISTYLTSLRGFCNFLISHKVLSTNPAKNVKGNYRKPQHSRATLNFKEVEKLFSVVQLNTEGGFRDFAILNLMSISGLTEIEIVRANVKDLKIRKNKSAILYVQGKREKSKSRFVELQKIEIDSIRNYLAFRFNPIPDEALFQTAGNRMNGKRMSTRGIRERVTHYLNKSGLLSTKKKISPFSLRHFAISKMVANGNTIEKIKSKFNIVTKATAMIYFNQQEK